MMKVDLIIISILLSFPWTINSELCLTTVACRDVCSHNPQVNTKVNSGNINSTNENITIVKSTNEKSTDVNCGKAHNTFCPCHVRECRQYNGTCFSVCADSARADSTVDADSLRGYISSKNTKDVLESSLDSIHPPSVNSSCNSSCVDTCVVSDSCSGVFCEEYQVGGVKDETSVGGAIYEITVVGHRNTTTVGRQSDGTAETGINDQARNDIRLAKDANNVSESGDVGGSRDVSTVGMAKDNNNIGGTTRGHTNVRSTKPTTPSPACPAKCAEGSCSNKTGKCLKCKPGYVGVDCTSNCSSEFYGEDCLQPCPVHCTRGQPACHHVSGACLHRCQSGYLGSHCDRKCSRGTFGTRCAHACPERCKEGRCNHETGMCTEGCLDGYYGEVCSMSCSSGKWGKECRENCGNFCLNRSCFPVTGFCRKCHPLMSGNHCNNTATPKLNVNEILAKPIIRRSELSVDNMTGLYWASGVIGMGALAWLVLGCLTYYKNKRSFDKLTKRGQMPRQWKKRSMRKGVLFATQDERRKQLIMQDLLGKAAKKRSDMGFTDEPVTSRTDVTKAQLQQDTKRNDRDFQPKSIIAKQLKSQFPNLQAGSVRPQSTGSRFNTIYLTNNTSEGNSPPRKKNAPEWDDIESLTDSEANAIVGMNSPLRGNFTESDDIDSVSLTTYPETFSGGDSIDRYVERALAKYFMSGHFPESLLQHGEDGGFNSTTTYTGTSFTPTKTPDTEYTGSKTNETDESYVGTRRNDESNSRIQEIEKSNTLVSSTDNSRDNYKTRHVSESHSKTKSEYKKRKRQTRCSTPVQSSEVERQHGSHDDEISSIDIYADNLLVEDDFITSIPQADDPSVSMPQLQPNLPPIPVSNDKKSKVSEPTSPKHATKDKKSVSFDTACKVCPVPPPRNPKTSRVRIVYDQETEPEPEHSMMAKGLANITAAVNRLVGKSPPTRSKEKPDVGSSPSRPANSLFLLSRMEEWKQKYPEFENHKPQPIGCSEVLPDQWPPTFHTLYP